MRIKYRYFVVSALLGLSIFTWLFMLYIAFPPKFPDGILLARPYSKYSYLVSDDFNYDFDDQSGRFYSNILVGPYVKWAKYQQPYIYGFNRQINDPDEDISPEGFFLIDYSKGQIFYLNKKTMDKILSGSKPIDLNLRPDVTFSKDPYEK